MAGGKLTETSAEGGRILEATHLLDHADPAKVGDKLVRQPCDFVEYHCMMIRSELLRDGEVLDPRMLSVHEHIDTALSVRQRGYPIFVEPSSGDLSRLRRIHARRSALFRERWSREAAESSIDAFCKKWNVVNDDRSFGILRTFVNGHEAQVDPIRTSAVARPDRLRPMRREELRQTRSDLLDLATERGYEPKEVAWLASCYHVAHVLTDGGYRPCGRPFINHLAGAASVLIRYDFRIEIVGAGLLHAAYTHCPPHQAGPRATANLVCTALGGKDSALEKRVRAYTKRESDRGALSAERTKPWTISIADAEITAIAAANEVDMHLSGEFRYSGRTDEVPPHVTAQIAHVCRVLGVDGLAETLLQAQCQPIAVEAQFLTRIAFSYRVGPDKRSLVRMVGDAVSALE